MALYLGSDKIAGIGGGSVNLNAIYNAVFPVGRGFIDFTNTDYSNYLGFTWERELVGMTAVGVDTTQIEFNTIGKTGGSKYLQEHNHNQYIVATSSPGGSNFAMAYNYTSHEPILGTPNIPSGTGNSENLQPYKVVSYWKRVS